GNKARALDLVAHTMGGGAGTANEIDKLRQTWADMANGALGQAGSAERIDHRSLEAQGIDRPPTRHMGPAVAGMARRGASSNVAERMAEEAEARQSAARETSRIEHELAEADRAILDLTGDLAGAIHAREERQREAERPPKGSTERTGPAVQSSRFKARPTEERQAATEESKPPTRRQAAAERNERTRQDLDAMPVEEQAKAFDIIQDAMAQKLKARLAKLDRLARKAADRRDRRAKAERKLREAEPLPPTGLLASLKRKGHETAWGQWRKVQRQAERIKEQAERLKDRLGKARSDLARLAYDNDPYALAKRGLERTNPEFMRRVDAHKAAEREKKNAELMKQAVELGEKRQEQARAELAREFRGLAARRAMKAHGFTDSSRKWQATPERLREIIDDYNSRPKEQQERALAAWMRDPGQSAAIAAMIEQRRENSRDRGMSR
ncbi:partial Mobilization protein A, partial [Myxococcaceae bacterium]